VKSKKKVAKKASYDGIEDKPIGGLLSGEVIDE
jgi:hypothetical protein